MIRDPLFGKLLDFLKKTLMFWDRIEGLESPRSNLPHLKMAITTINLEIDRKGGFPLQTFLDPVFAEKDPTYVGLLCELLYRPNLIKVFEAAWQHDDGNGLFTGATRARTLASKGSLSRVFAIVDAARTGTVARILDELVQPEKEITPAKNMKRIQIVMALTYEIRPEDLTEIALEVDPITLTRIFHSINGLPELAHLKGAIQALGPSIAIRHGREVAATLVG